MAIIPTSTSVARGIIGTWANMEEDNARTGFAEAEFPAGVPLTYGAAEMGVAPLEDGDKFIGIALRTVDMFGTPTADGEATFTVGSLLGVADMGAVFVRAGDDVTEGANVFYDPTDGLYHGATGEGRLPLAGCEFDESASNGQPVAMRIRLVPGSAAVAAEE